MLYGYSPFYNGKVQRVETKEAEDGNIELIPAMKVKTRILCIRNVPSGTPVSYGRTYITKRRSRIGVIALGYADGYFRFFSNNSEVLVKGKRVPVVGRVCMDLTMIDLTDVVGAEENDDVIILGRQGDESITADELALKANTISYEILTTLGSRSNRIYVENH
jgi:alanine racemase